MYGMFIIFMMSINRSRKLPDWLKVKLPSAALYSQLKSKINGAATNTVCEEARCPNLGECWSRNCATIMILGDVCTRACRYCSVKTGRPGTPDWGEPEKVAKLIARLGLKYTVITSVTRDDLKDGGAGIFAETILQVKKQTGCRIEVLTPDYSSEQLRTILSARPDVYSHNIETVQRLFSIIKSKGRYKDSLSVLKHAKIVSPYQKTKSAIMLGLGESEEEIICTMEDLKESNVDYLALGQYLQPSKDKYPVAKYCTPEYFRYLKQLGKSIGFLHIEAGPLVRSSYRAESYGEY